MISSIVVTGCHSIGINSANKIEVEGNVLSIDKEIPFVRYRFNNYDDNSIAYINAMKTKFVKSTHLVEINISELGSQNTLEILQKINTNIESIAKFLYITITDENVQSGMIDQSIVNTLVSSLQFGIDRIMLKDKSNTLDMMATKKLIRQLMSATKLSEDTFGVCSSPLSFGDLACFTAIKAREIMSKYSAVADVALPTANHQCMNCCGCARYIVVSTDTQAPVETATKTSKPKSENVENKKTTVSKPKTFLQPGRFSL